MLSDQNLIKLQQFKLNNSDECQNDDGKTIENGLQTRKQKRESLNHGYHWYDKDHLICCCVCKIVFAERNFNEHYKEHLRPEKSASNSLKETYQELDLLAKYLKSTDGYQDIKARKRYEMLKKDYIRRKSNSGYVRFVQGGAPK